MQKSLLSDWNESQKHKDHKQKVTDMQPSFSDYDGIQGKIVVPDGIHGGVVELKGKKNINYRSLMGREH